MVISMVTLTPRVIAVFLIFCLVGNPTEAGAFTAGSSSPTHSHANIALFQEEALLEVVAVFTHPSIHRKFSASIFHTVSTREHAIGLRQRVTSFALRWNVPVLSNHLAW